MSRTLSGKQAVVRDGYLPERDLLTGAGPVSVKVPNVRDRSETGVQCKLNGSATLCQEVAARFGGLAVPEKHLDLRHER
jgi:hypothetical protein